MRLIAALAALVLACAGPEPLLANTAGAKAAYRQATASGRPVPLFNLSTTRFCRGGRVGAPPFAGEVGRASHTHGAGREALTAALEWMNRGISSAATSQAAARDLANGLTRMAQAKAFTRAGSANGGSSPRHWQMNLLKNVAMAVNVIDHRGAWPQGARQVVVSWGNGLWAGANRGNPGWPDTVATFGAAGILWGLAAPNRSAYDRGLRHYDKVARLIQPGGALPEYFPARKAKYFNELPANWGARITDKMIGDLVLSAYAVRRAGADLFSQRRSGGGSLHEAVVTWQNTLFGNHPAMQGQDRSFLRAQGQEASWSWTEYFIAIHPNDPATAALRQRSAGYRGSGYVGLAMGPASCLAR